jgi:formyl-CoA transferase
MGGIMQVTGVPGAGPLRAGISVGDLTAGLFCAYGILVALLERDVSGRGQWVQTSLLQALAFMLDFQAARWLMDGAVPKQHGNFHPTIAPCGTFRTKDSHINLALVGQTMWERLCDAFGKPEWREDPEFRTNADRLAHSARLKSEIEEVLATENSAYWVEHLNAKSVACGPIYGVDEMFDDAQFRSLGMVQALDGDRGAVSYLGQPIVLTRTPSGIVKHPPRLGEDTDDVLAAVGYSPDDVAGFRAAHIV